MTKFIVYEDKWLRGGEQQSFLLNANGERCCMGFLAKHCGIPDEALLGVSDFAGIDPKWWHLLPEDVQPVDEDSSGFQDWPHGEKACEIYHDNDNAKVDDETRKKDLDESFGVAGIEVVFEPKSP